MRRIIEAIKKREKARYDSSFMAWDAYSAKIEFLDTYNWQQDVRRRGL